MSWRRLITAAVLTVGALLSGCGGGGAPAVIPEAQAAEPVSGCPTGDATAQLQAMVDTAKGRLDLPLCVFNTSAAIRVSKPLQIVGKGSTVDGTIIRSTADEAVVLDPDVKINVALGPNKRGWWGGFKDLRIEPAVQGGGRHGLVLRVRAGFFLNNWKVEDVHIGDFGQQCAWLDNSANNTDGIFTGSIVNVFCENGYLMTNVGDSVRVVGGVVTNGPSRFGKPGLPGFDISMQAGAAEVTLREVNITTGGGCVRVRNGIGISLLGLWCESPGTPVDGAVGMIHLTNCAECLVWNTRIQTLAGDTPYALAIEGGEGNEIASNKLVLGKKGHIALLGNTRNNFMTGANKFSGGASIRAGVIDGASTGLVQ